MIWLLNCFEFVLEYMRIEITGRRDNSTFELLAPDGAGEANAARLVWLFGNRQPTEGFLDQIRTPISLLIFEPFCATVRPNVLRDHKQQKPQGPCETKRHQKALNSKEPVNELSTCFVEEGPRRKQRF